MTGAPGVLARVSLVALLALCGGPAGATSVSVGGRLAFPTDGVPSLVVHAWSPATGQRLDVTTRPGQVTYELQLPPGRWFVFATPADPGAPPVYGAHTRFTLCARDPRQLQSGACRDHAPVAIEVGRDRLERVDVTDWFLDDATIAALDRALGRPGESWTEATLAAPKFSEYPPSGAGPALAGANFAGRFALVRVPCAPVAGDLAAAYEDVALTDLASGRLLRPELLAALPVGGPCPGVDVLQFRRDSRLLTITIARGGDLVTRYLVWNAEQLAFRLVAELSSPLAERCGG